VVEQGAIPPSRLPNSVWKIPPCPIVLGRPLRSLPAA
jgi:hypothetical protein